MMKSIRVLFLSFCFANLGTMLFTSSPAVAESIKVGDTPQLIAHTFSGEVFDLSKERGHWVIVHFFASWCPGCKTEMPELSKLYQKYHASGLDLIALSPEPARKKKDVQNFVKEFPAPVGLIADAKINDFGANVVLPTTFLIYKEGKIKSIFPAESKSLNVSELEVLIKP